MSSLNSLREKFDKVIIKYGEKSCEVMLVDGLDTHVGLSKCHENDNFDRKLGRKIALGRAEFAYKLTSGKKEPRDNVAFRDGGSRYITAKFDDITKLDEYIVSFLPKRKSHKAS